jgi:hypothetical protein
VASLERSHKAWVKPAFYLGRVNAYSRGPLSNCRVFIVVDAVGVAMVPGAIIPATPTPGFHSLGLGAARRVVPRGRSAHSGLARVAMSAPQNEGRASH